MRPLVFSMCQGRSALENLAEWEREGVRIINSPRAALNTHRDRLPALMVEAAFRFRKPIWSAPRTSRICGRSISMAASG